ETVQARRADDREPAGRGGDEEVATEAAQAGWVDEACQLDLPDVLRLVLAGQQNGHRAVTADGNLHRILGHDDLRLQRETVRCDDAPLRVPLKRAVPRVGDGPVGQEDLEE